MVFCRTATARVIVILTCLLHVTFSSRDTGTYDMFAKNDAIKDHVCPDSDVLFEFKANVSSSRCVVSCWLNSTCKNVFYQSETGRCVGSSSLYSTTDNLIQSTGMEYYGYVTTKSHGATCDDNDPCSGANLNCTNGTCICQIGYSYDPRTQSCVDYCDTYGTTFQVYPQYKLADLNMRTFVNMTLEACKQECLSETRCRSFEYLPKVLKCFIAEATALSNPENVQYDIGTIDYYTRNCE